MADGQQQVTLDMSKAQPLPAAGGGAPVQLDMSKAKPLMGGASGSYQQAPQPTMVQSALSSVGSAAKSAAPVLREGALGFAGGLGIPETMNPVTDLAKGLVKPYSTPEGIADFMSDPSFGAFKAIKSTAQGLYGAGKDIYDSFKQKDPSLAAHGIGYLAGQATQLKGLTKVPEGAARDYNAATALSEASGNPLGLSGTLMTRALARATQAADSIGQFFKKGEAVQANSVQDSVRSIQIADQMKSRAAGKQGSIDTTHTQAAIDQALDQVGIQAGSASSKAIGLMEGMISPNATFEQAKQLRTVLGTLGRATKNPADRMVIGAARQQLTESMEARAKEIGQTSNWKSYNDIWRNLEQAKDTWQQDLYDAASPGSGSAYAMHRIVNGEHWGKIQQAAKELQSEFGVDNKEFFDNVAKLKKNVDWAPLDRAGVNFRGVLGTIGKHPVTGLAAYGAAQALGLPFLARFLSVAAAGKLQGVLSQMGEPRAAMPEVYGKLPEGGAPPQQPPSVLTEPPHPIPPQHDYLNGAPPQTPEIDNAVQSIQQERAAAASSGLPPDVGKAKPIERRVTGGESPTGEERRVRPIGTVPAGMNSVENVIRAKLGKGGLSSQEETTLRAQLADIEKNPPTEGEGQRLAQQIRAARAGSLGKATPLSDPSPALAEEVKTAKQATFAAHQRAKGKR